MAHQPPHTSAAFARDIARYLDEVVGRDAVPDYPGALNGLQVDNLGPITGIVASVDVSLTVLNAATNAGANFLIVHHGLFWNGPQALVGATYQRFRTLLTNDVAVYASHLPLDAHPVLGNNVLLAGALELKPSRPFASYRGAAIGLAGETDVPTAALIDRVRHVVEPFGATVRTSRVEPGRKTRHWGICTGAGASSETLREAVALGLDTLIVGEGPHHTAVDAPDWGLVILYAGHYATETLGVQALARAAATHFGLPWRFLNEPTGL